MFCPEQIFSYIDSNKNMSPTFEICPNYQTYFCQFMFLDQVRLRQKYYAPQVRPEKVQTNDLQIMTVHFTEMPAMTT